MNLSLTLFCRLSQAHTPLKTTHWNEWECSSCVEDIAAPLITTFPCALLFSATSSHDSQQPAYTHSHILTQRHLHYQTPTTALPLLLWLCIDVQTLLRTLLPALLPVSLTPGGMRLETRRAWMCDGIQISPLHRTRHNWYMMAGTPLIQQRIKK